MQQNRDHLNKTKQIKERFGVLTEKKKSFWKLEKRRLECCLKNTEENQKVQVTTQFHFEL